MAESQRAHDIIKEFERRSTDRSTTEGHWQEIAERVMPSAKDLFQSHSRSSMTDKGAKKNELVYDSTAAVALNRFASILDSLLTPRNQTWHRLSANDSNLNKIRAVREYFESANSVLFKYRYAARANFASQNQMTYKSLGAFGTGSLFIDELYGEPGIRYRNLFIGTLYIDENHQGQVDSAIRHFPMTARQAKQKWPEKLPKEITDAAEKSPEKEFYFLQCVKPRTEGYDPGLKDYKGMKWESVYVSITGKTELSEGGYNTFPFTTPRYEQAPNEVWGRSPAMDVLPAIKTLNEQKKTLLKQGHRAVDPVLLAHDDGIVDSFSLRPGAINAGGVSADGRPLVHALPVGNLAVGKDMMDDERTLINDAFLITLFQILVENPQMSATEVLERTREKGILLAPTIGRVQTEHCGVMIERELDVLSMQGLLPPMPPELVEAGGMFVVDYDSPLSRAQRAEEAAGTMRSVENALNIVNITQDPSPLDHFNWDIIVPELSDIQGVPVRFMRSMEEIQRIRQGRAQQAAAQQVIQAAPGVAAVTKAIKA